MSMPAIGRCAMAGAVVVALVAMASGAADIAPADQRSGYAFMGRETRAMQDDDTANPGMLFVLDGEALWVRKVGDAAKSCADCHGDATASMSGVAARYPAFDAARGRPIDLEERINICRGEWQQAPTLPFESQDLLALTAYVAHQSRGQPVAIADDPRMHPFIEAGRALFQGRQGQLNLSCAECHERIPPAIRSIGSNGRAWDRCSGGCATASAACAPNPMPTARPSSSTSSSISCGAPGGSPSRRRRCGPDARLQACRARSDSDVS